MNEIDIYSGRLEEHGPLHIVMHSANELLGREHAEEDHPYVVAKAIIPDIRRFTEAIIRCVYYLPIKLSRTPRVLLWLCFFSHHACALESRFASTDFRTRAPEEEDRALDEGRERFLLSEDDEGALHL